MGHRIVGLVMMGCLFTGQSFALQRTLTPNVVSRIVNPENSGDVRVLIKFEIPEDIQRSEIILATLKVATVATREVPFAIGPLEVEWSGQDDWAAAASRLVDSPGFVGTASECEIVTNHLETIENGVIDGGVETIITPWVMGWLNGANHGLAIRSVADRNDDVSRHFPPSSIPVVDLVILYTVK